MRVTLSPRLPSLSVLGVLIALIAWHQSMAPSMMVRDWYFQGAVTGLAVPLGYALGSFAQWVLGLVVRGVARLTGRTLPALSDETRARLNTGFWVVVAVLFVLGAWQTIRQQRWTWERLGHDPANGTLRMVATVLLVIVVAALLVGIVALVRWLMRRASRIAGKVLPRVVAGVVASALVLWVVLAGLNTWVFQRTLDGLNETFTLSDGIIQEDIEAPTSLLRSAGPASAADWEKAGREGRRFLAGGPEVDEIAALHPSASAIEPIRVFVGREQADEIEERTEIAMRDLETFGAFDREVLLVVIPTGTGWVNEQTVQPLEYMYAGDVATVAVQYSHLPSPLAFVTEAHTAQDAGKALIGAVSDRIAAMDEADRPQLLVSGESLGSFGASGAYDSLQDVLASTSASLWIGPPSSVHLRTQAEDERVEGSLQIRPEWPVSDELFIANRPSDLVEVMAEERTVRATILQQPDDAIVWWDWSTAVKEPDWLKEPLDETVNPDMRWYPLSTFLNLAVDMAVATAFQEYQGHMYGTQPALAWRAMVAPPEWQDDALFDALIVELRKIERTI